MTFKHIHNRRGFFSDYYLGSIFGRQGGRGRKRRLSDRDTDSAYGRFLRLHERAEGRCKDTSETRERYIRPLLRDVLGFHLGAGEDKVHLMFYSAEEEGAGAGPRLAVYCGGWDEDLDAGRGGARPLAKLEAVLSHRGLQYGLLVTGERIRLVRASGDGPRGACLEADLEGLAEDQDPESFAVLYRLLQVSNFLPDETGTLPVTAMERDSREHARKVSEDLKAAVFTSAETLVAGLLMDAHRHERLGDPAEIGEADLRRFRDAALTALYRILFILYAEARDPRLEEHEVYRKSYSAQGLVDEILQDPARQWPENRASLWARLRALFRIYDRGLPAITPWQNIPPRGGDFFSSGTSEGRLLEDAGLPDAVVSRLIVDLATTPPQRGVGRERVSFRELDIESLGAVYEGLLEYEPRVARETTIELVVAGKKYALSPSEVVRLCRAKNLLLKGDQSLLAGTEASVLVPDGESTVETDAPEEDDTEGIVTESSEEEDDDELVEEAVKKGSAARLLRRLEPGAFHFVPGAARKGSGSFYTPLPLVKDLVRHALGPMVGGKSSVEIQSLRVLDPACGSAHFLVEAMRYLGRALHQAFVEEGGGKPPPEFRSTTGQGWDEDWRATDEAARATNSEARAWCKRRIAERCLFGVDMNPTAVNLARVALWVESVAGDRPLTYFHHHIRCGNSLLGTWRARLDKPPLPDMRGPEAAGQRGLFETLITKALDRAASIRGLIDGADPGALRREGVDPESIREQEFKEHQRLQAESLLSAAKLLVDLRSASAFIPAIYRDWVDLCGLVSQPDVLRRYAAGRPWWGAFESVLQRERFFHWEWEFPEVFLDPTRPGFDVVLGNPPWDKVLPTKHEFYARYDVLIRAFKGNELDQRIREIQSTRPDLAEQFEAYQGRTRTVAHLLRRSGDFPLSKGRTQAAHEDLSKYFVDRSARLVRKGGAVGLVVPSVVYNGDGCVGIRRFLLEETRIERFYGFENRRKIFPIDSRYKFVSLVFRKEEPGDGFDGAFMRHDLAELEEEGPRPWTVRLSREEIARLSPLTLAFVEYRSKRDQAICTKMYAGCRTIGDVGPESWGAKLISDLSHVQIYNSARDKDLWTNPETKRAFSPETVIGRAEPTRGATIRGMLERGYLPVFEGKSVDQFVVGTRPVRWWLEASRAEKKYRRLPRTDKLLVFRMIARNTDERTCIAAVLPPGSAATDTLAGVLLTHVEPDAAASVLNSFCFDYALRLRSAGTKLSFTYVRPCPVPRPGVVNMLPRIATSISGGAYREHVTEAESVWPALWNSNRGVAEAYGLGPDDLEHILSSFTVLARKRPAYFAYLKERLSEWTAQAGRTRRGSAPERLAQVAEGLEDRGISEPANGGPSPGAEE